MEVTWTCAPGWKTMDILTRLPVACNEPVGILTPDGVRRRVEAAQVETFLLGAHDWQRLSMSEGTKGPRLFDWAAVPMLHRWEADGCHWLLIRRSLTDPSAESVLRASLLPKGPPCQRWLRLLAHAGTSKRNSRTPKTWGWTTTKCAASSVGTGTSPLFWWLSPS
jgi:hypothetical protein